MQDDPLHGRPQCADTKDGKPFVPAAASGMMKATRAARGFFGLFNLLSGHRLSGITIGERSGLTTVMPAGANPVRRWPSDQVKPVFRRSGDLDSDCRELKRDSQAVSAQRKKV
jgi:hypothetical protein